PYTAPFRAGRPRTERTLEPIHSLKLLYDAGMKRSRLSSALLLRSSILKNGYPRRNAAKKMERSSIYRISYSAPGCNHLVRQSSKSARAHYGSGAFLSQQKAFRVFLSPVQIFLLISQKHQVSVRRPSRLLKKPFFFIPGSNDGHLPRGFFLPVPDPVGQDPDLLIRDLLLPQPEADHILQAGGNDPDRNFLLQTEAQQSQAFCPWLKQGSRPGQNLFRNLFRHVQLQLLFPPEFRLLFQGTVYVSFQGFLKKRLSKG